MWLPQLHQGPSSFWLHWAPLPLQLHLSQSSIYLCHGLTGLWKCLVLPPLQLRRAPPSLRLLSDLSRMSSSRKAQPNNLATISNSNGIWTVTILHCVGLLPRSKSGHKYFLTIMCAAACFLCSINARVITKALVTFFTLFGLPKTIQVTREQI